MYVDKEDLVPGRVYVYNIKHFGDRVFRYKGAILRPESKNYSKIGDYMFNCEPIRKANTRETNHLERCEAAGKYVPYQTTFEVGDYVYANGCVLLYKGKGMRSQFFRIGGRSFDKRGCNWKFKDCANVRLASIDEANQLKACIKAGKYVEANVSQPTMGSNNNKSSNHGKQESNIIKTNRLVSRVSRGERPSGNAIRGRSSKSTVNIRHLSYTISVVKS